MSGSDGYENKSKGGDDAVPPSPEPESGDLAAQAAHIAALQNELRDMKDRYLRSVAEADNTRKRAEKAAHETAQFVYQKFARDLLSVADNFRRALDALPLAERKSLPEGTQSVLQGIEATERELLGVFERHGMVRLFPKGQKFDPHHHQAIAEAPSPDVPAGSVMDVMQAGFTLSGRLLRPAMVLVSKGPAAVAPNGADGAEPGGRLDTKA